MEERPTRKTKEAIDMRIAYQSSKNSGNTWTKKKIIDVPSSLLLANPALATNNKGDTYLTCMQINKDTFSGLIPIYTYNEKKKEFILKSIAHETNNSIMDKPAILANGNDIYVAYIEYTKTFDTFLKFLISYDKGVSWSKPKTISFDKTVHLLGVSLTLLTDISLAISVGSYGANSVYLINANIGIDNIKFQIPRKIQRVSTQLANAMTEISNDGKTVLLNWQPNHSPNEVYISSSSDCGTTWRDPIMLSPKGALVSTAFDMNSNIHCLYSDFTNDAFSVQYKIYTPGMVQISQQQLNDGNRSGMLNDYLGAFQKLIVQEDEVLAFWIDISDNHQLKLTRWKISN